MYVDMKDALHPGEIIHNTSGKTQKVLLSGSHLGASYDVTVEIGTQPNLSDAVRARIQLATTNISSRWGFPSFEVEPGEYYRVTVDPPTLAIEHWLVKPPAQAG